MAYKTAKKNSATLAKQTALRTQRALAMVDRRIHNTSMKQVAAEFNVSRNTVMNELKWAERQGLYQAARDHILQNLVPKATQIYEKSLDYNLRVDVDNPGLDAARDVLQGTAILKKKGSPLDEIQQGEQSLALYMENRRQLAAAKKEEIVQGNTNPLFGPNNLCITVHQTENGAKASVDINGVVLEAEAGSERDATLALQQKIDEAALRGEVNLG